MLTVGTHRVLISGTRERRGPSGGLWEVGDRVQDKGMKNDVGCVPVPGVRTSGDCCCSDERHCSTLWCGFNHFDIINKPEAISRKFTVWSSNICLHGEVCLPLRSAFGCPRRSFRKLLTCVPATRRMPSMLQLSDWCHLSGYRFNGSDYVSHTIRFVRLSDCHFTLAVERQTSLIVPTSIFSLFPMLPIGAKRNLHSY